MEGAGKTEDFLARCARKEVEGVAVEGAGKPGDFLARCTSTVQRALRASCSLQK